MEPVDYDAYIEQNYANLRKDQCSRQLILLPTDDIYADDYEIDLNQPSSPTNSPDSTLAQSSESKSKNACNNMFVTDCLQTYLNRKFEVKYKYHMFGGSYRQLPMYKENSILFLENLNEKK